jgi:hypothetical protein
MFRPGTPLPGTGDDAGSGQPRPVEGARHPTPAERVRTLVESSVSAALTVPGIDCGPPDPLGAAAPRARAVTADGDVLLLVPQAAPAARAAARAHADDLHAVVELTDVAPVAVPHRVRGRAWVAGWLTSVRPDDRAHWDALLAERCPEASGTLRGAVPLRLEVGEAYVDDLWGVGMVEPDDFAAARPDPLVRHESGLLQHLASAHGDRIRALCALLEEEETGTCGWDRAQPLSLDRHGLRVRFSGGGRCFDARFEFPDPVRDVAELRRAMHRLFDAAR